MSTHPGHPALQSLHAHLNELLLKSPWNRPQKQVTKHLQIFFYALCFIISRQARCSPVTCLSGKEGIGIAEPNLSSNLSYSQSKCLYLWLTGRFVFCKSNTRQLQTHAPGVATEKSLLFHFQEQLVTHTGCNLVLNVALEAVHLWAFLGVGHHAVQLSFWVEPHWADFSNLSIKQKVELPAALGSTQKECLYVRT